MSTAICRTLSPHAPSTSQPPWESPRKQKSRSRDSTNLRLHLNTAVSEIDQHNIASSSSRTSRSHGHTSTRFSSRETEPVGRKPSSHIRAQSDASLMHAAVARRMTKKQTRQRNASVSLVSLAATSSRLLSHRVAAPAVLEKNAGQQTLGAFAPTNSPYDSLRLVLAGAAAADAASRAAQMQLDDMVDQSVASDDDHSHTVSDVLSSPPSSPAIATPPIPSICRTPSSYTGSEYFPTAPSSAGPSTPRSIVPPSRSPKNNQTTLHPALEALERSSKLTMKSHCSACKKEGTNFPTCPRCGEMWCSRDCRLQGSGGKRHICAK